VRSHYEMTDVLHTEQKYQTFSLYSVPPNCVKFLLSKRHSETTWVPWTLSYNQQARPAKLLTESNRLQSHKKNSTHYLRTYVLTVDSTVTEVPMVGMVTYVVIIVTSVLSYKSINQIDFQHNYFSCDGRQFGLYFYTILLYTTGWKASDQCPMATNVILVTNGSK
jgi:hypothetical protein